MNSSVANSTTLHPPLDWEESDSNETSFFINTPCPLNQTEEIAHDYDKSISCQPVWDNIFCWPQTPGGTNVSELCSVVFTESYPKYAAYLQGNAYRSCLENGTWADGARTNYEECAVSFEEYEKKVKDETTLVEIVQHILFTGSILSLVCLALSLAIFWYFRCLRCDRVALLIQLMLALVLRFTVLLIITEPFVFERNTNYRDLDILCKFVILLHLYATVTSVSWMFLQGLYLNGKLTSSSFNDSSRENFPLYYSIGWGLPAVLLMFYLSAMVYNHSTNTTKCWKGYADMPEIWILLGPMVAGLLVNNSVLEMAKMYERKYLMKLVSGLQLNGLFLVHIMRILLNRLRRINDQGFESTQICAAAKATLLLSPVLGVNNLLLLYNPGGDYEKYYVISNALCGSTQGFFVCVVFCFCNKDVQEVIRRLYHRKRTNRYKTRQCQRGSVTATHLQLYRVDRRPPSTTAETVI